MKMRKNLALFLMLAVLGVSLWGNGNKENSIEEVNILYPGEETDRMSEFLENEFAEIMKNDLGIKLNITFVSWDSYWAQKDIMLAAQEPIDLYWDGLPDISTIVNKKQAQPLDSLIQEYGQDMLKVIPMSQIQGGQINGITYGIPSAYAPSSAMFQLITVRQDLLEAVGMKSIESPDDLMKFSKKAKEKFPHIKGGGDSIFKPLTRYYADEQYYWIASEDLVVFGEESFDAYSYYHTEAFKELSKFNRRMTEAGQYSDEVTIKYNERDSRMQSGNYLWVEGSLGKDLEIINSVRQNVPEAVLKSYLLSPEKPTYITAAGGEVICIPQTAPNPTGAMRFLNWMYKSLDNYNISLFGIEGKDYVIENERIESLNGDEFFYEWMFRNKNYQMFSKTTDQEFVNTYTHWDDDAIVSKSFGFRFDNTNVKGIESQLNQVVGKLFIPIQTGFVDFETEYPIAIQKLEEAGMVEYLAEVNAQLEAFLENK